MLKDWTGNSKAAIAGIAPSNHSLKNRESDDFYATDPKAVDMLCNLEKFSQTILEPACGQGHIAKALEAHGYKVLACALVDRGYGTTGSAFPSEEVRVHNNESSVQAGAGIRRKGDERSRAGT